MLSSGAAAAARHLPPSRPQPNAFPPAVLLQVPLETLSSELQSHLGALKNKLVEVSWRCFLCRS